MPRDSSEPIVRVVVTNRSNSLAACSAIAGLLAFLVIWIPFLGCAGIPMAALGLLFAVLGFLIALGRSGHGLGLAIVGGGLSAFVLAMPLLGIAAIGAAVVAANEAANSPPAIPSEKPLDTTIAAAPEPSPTVPIQPPPASPASKPAAVADPPSSETTNQEISPFVPEPDPIIGDFTLRAVYMLDGVPGARFVDGAKILKVKVGDSFDGFEVLAIEFKAKTVTLRGPDGATVKLSPKRK